MNKNAICIWYEKDAEAAARFYAEVFPASSVSAVHRAPGDFPSGKRGDVLTVEFTLAGVACIGLNGGPMFRQSEAFSFQIATDDQEETDRFGNRCPQERLRLVQGQVGRKLVDHAVHVDRGRGRRRRGGHARVRRDNDHEQD